MNFTLHLAFTMTSKKILKKNNDVAIKVDPSQYEDNIDEAKDVMKNMSMLFTLMGKALVVERT